MITLTFYIIEIKILSRNIYDCTVTLFFSLIFRFVTVNYNSWGYIRKIQYFLQYYLFFGRRSDSALERRNIPENQIFSQSARIKSFARTDTINALAP